MLTDITGLGWAFPPQVNRRGNMALTNQGNELDQSINIILSTAPGQRVMRPNFGCRLHELVFSPNNSTTRAQARRYVEQALGMWEPRIIVKEVRVNSDPDREDSLLIEISYEVKTNRDKRSLVYPFYIIPEES